MFKNFNIRIIVLIALFIGLAIPMLFTTIYLQNIYEENLKNKLVKTHEELIKTISSGLSRPMWEFRHDNAKKLVEPIFKNEDILEIKVVDSKYDDIIFLHFKKKKLLNNSYCPKSKNILFEENIVLNKIKLGKIFMNVSTCKIDYQIMEQHSNLWLTMGVQFIISFMILFLLIHFKIIEPVKKLIKQSNALSQKNLNNPFKWEQNDEIGLLGQSLENTRQALLVLFNKEQESKDKIEKLNKNLELKVESRAKKLIKVNNELTQTIDNLKMTQEQLVHSEKMASLGNMVAGIAHEMNTPIGIGITGATHFQEITKEIKKSYEENNISQNEFEEYLSTSENLANAINKNLERASETIRSFKKIAVEQNIEDMREINLYEYTKDFVNSMYGTLLKTKIRIDVDVDSKINIYYSPGSYVQLLMILVTNSLLHGYDEGDSGLIGISIKENNDMIIIEYRDNGKGIDINNIKHIYEPFFTTKRGHGGSGLGLNILYNIIANSYNGQIKCKSKLGEGVKFIITLPQNLK